MPETNVVQKTGKWTEDEINDLKSYDPKNSDESVQGFVKTMNRSKRSVIGKLGHMGLYVAPEKPKAAKKDDGPTKGEILTAIGKTGYDVTGLDASTKPALKYLQNYIASVKTTD